MNKCKICGSKMVELFSSCVCPNDCKGDAPLNPPKEKKVVTHSRSGGSILTEEEAREQQKQKMLKALANFNTLASNLIDGMTNVVETVNDVIIAMEKFSKEISELPKNTVVMSYKGRCYACHSKALQVLSRRLHYSVECLNCGIHGPCANNIQNAIDSWQKMCDDYFTRLEEKHGLNNPKDKEYAADWYCQEYQCKFEPLPMPPMMEEAIKAETYRLMQEQEQKIIATFGIPRRLINQNNDLVGLTDDDLKSLCKKRNIVLYNHDGEKNKIQDPIQKRWKNGEEPGQIWNGKVWLDAPEY